MKTTITGFILGGVMAFTLAACNTTPMNDDSTMGSSVGSNTAGTTAAGGATPMKGDTAPRGATPVNCTTNTTADNTSVPTVPGTNCPAESH